MTTNADDYRVDDSPFLTVEEVARYLKISKMKVYRMIHGGVLPATRTGRLYRIRHDDFTTYMAATEYKP